jgi:2-phosphosulfolactate phosphatase
VAAQRDIQVWPSSMDEGAAGLAREIGAELARGRRTGSGPTLSPVSLQEMEHGSRLVLPSASAAAITHAAVKEGVPAVAGCLRNARAAASYAADFDRVGIVPAGETWPDGSLRLAYEDLVGAGAVASAIQSVDGEAELSPEADAAVAAYTFRRSLDECPSGRDLIARGFTEDVRVAEDVDADDVVPLLRGGRYVAWRPDRSAA